MDSDNLEKINTILDADVDIREKIKEQVTEFDKKTRTLSGILNRIHSTRSEKLPALLATARPVLASCRETTAALADIIPPHQFWKWKDMWTNSLRTAVFAATLAEYLQDGALLSIQQAAEILGIKPEWQDRLALPVEDYLHGVINLVNELSRLAVNAVTLGDFDQPIKISLFVKDVFTGFSMLNLKNDLLRRRYDSLKYDIKKIEEVVYDVSLRKLAPSAKQDS
ncbi:Translin [Trametes versicolor FP-101664 SS1]|uniref:Translin n=1 Tax=Trametes versicolor (strain FP-101664) TaxID=717944 RepID=UPI00046239ED|nr:Translin [Trametes versicolor FP-101664 SS1]EIW59484.1 Translin [Trametes versicolor FP-101664 SS1]